VRNYITYWASCLLLLLILVTAVGESNAQSTGGIGAMLKLDTTKDGYTLPRIQSLVPNGPASKTVKEGLYIISVNGVPCKNVSLEQIVGNIRGQAGTKVTLMLADNPNGKQAKEYEIERAEIQQVPAGDPVETFHAECEATLKQLKRQGHIIERNINSDCGDYFFNFDAEPGIYHVRLIVMSDGKKSDESIIAKVSGWDGNKEVALKSTGGNTYEEHITFTRSSVGVIATTLKDKQSCKAIHIVVYK
jgi:hypothetical protein